MSNYDIDWDQYFLPDHWWNLDETTGAIIDSGKIGGADEVSSSGQTLGKLGKVGNAVKFTDGDDHIVVNHKTPESHRHTVALWLRRDGTGGAENNERPISQSNTDASWDFEYWRTSGSFIGYCFDSSSNLYSPLIVVPIADFTEWNFFVRTYDSVNGVKLYRNGILVDTVATVGLPLRKATTYNLTIGARQDNHQHGWNGLIDDVRIWLDRVLTASEIKQLYIHTNNYRDQALPIIYKPAHDSYTKLYCTFDGDTYDESGSEHIFDSGDGALSSTQVKFGTYSMYFDGSSNIIYPDHDDWNFGDEDFTIDFWLYYDEAAGTTRKFAVYGGGSDTWDATSGGLAWQVFLLNTDILYFQCSQGGSSFISLYKTSAGISSAWHHIAIVREGSTATLYLDGVSVDTESISSIPAITGGTNNLKIGSSTADTYYTLGYISDIRISKGIARWSSNFTVPTDHYEAEREITLSLLKEDIVSHYPFQWFKLDGTTDTVEDSGSLGQSATNSDTVYKLYTGNRQKPCRLFVRDSSSAGDYIDCGTHDFGDDFTISFWAYYNSYPSLVTDYYALVCKIDTLAGADMRFRFLAYSDDCYRFDSNSGASVSATTKIITKQWVHVTIVHDDSDDDVLYINGEEVERASAITLGTDTASALTIGGQPSAGHDYFDGMMHDVQFYRAVLSQDEVYRIFKHRLPTNALGDYCAEYHKDIIEKNIIKPVSNAFSGAVLAGKDRVVDPDEAMIIQPGDF